MSIVPTSDYIKVLSRFHPFWDRTTEFTTFDDEGNEIGTEEIAHLTNEEIICDICNADICESEIYCLNYIEKGVEYISKAVCKGCYKEYYEQYPIFKQPLINQAYLFMWQARSFPSVIPQEIMIYYSFITDIHQFLSHIEEPDLLFRFISITDNHQMIDLLAGVFKLFKENLLNQSAIKEEAQITEEQKSIILSYFKQALP